MFNVKNVTLESIIDSISSMYHIVNVAPITFQAINKVIAFPGAITNGIVGFFYVVGF